MLKAGRGGILGERGWESVPRPSSLNEQYNTHMTIKHSVPLVMQHLPVQVQVLYFIPKQLKSTPSCVMQNVFYSGPYSHSYKMKTWSVLSKEDSKSESVIKCISKFTIKSF